MDGFHLIYLLQKVFWKVQLLFYIMKHCHNDITDYMHGTSASLVLMTKETLTVMIIITDNILITLFHLCFTTNETHLHNDITNSIYVVYCT